jgi:hypothetical protein
MSSTGCDKDKNLEHSATESEFAKEQQVEGKNRPVGNNYDHIPAQQGSTPEEQTLPGHVALV